MNLSPQIISLEGGALGYFYSLDQLEYLRYKRIHEASDTEVYGFLMCSRAGAINSSTAQQEITRKYERK